MIVLEKDYLTPKELSDYWCIDTKTLQKWRTLGTGPEYGKLGRFVRYKIKDILTYEQNHKYRGTGERIFPTKGDCDDKK